MQAMPRYIEKIPVDPSGIVDEQHLPVPLPYGLAPRDFFRTVEDVHDLLHDLNSLLHERQYQRSEELLDSASFSGLISRTVATRLARAGRALVVNRFHNGYPDLLVRGQYPHDAVQHGEGGLEIKASRYTKGWQSHGPRAGWFAVVQFELDEREDVAVYDLEPTRIRSVMVAELVRDDWSWQPAREGRIWSGTASIRSSGVAKLRRGAVWVDPAYRPTHNRLAADAYLAVFKDRLPDLIPTELARLGTPASSDQLAVILALAFGVPEQAARPPIDSALRKLRLAGKVRRVGRTTYGVT